MIKGDQQRMTHHKMFVPYSTHSNSAFSGTSFMLVPLYAIGRLMEEGKVIK